MTTTIAYPTNKFEEYFLTENVMRFLPVLKRLIKYADDNNGLDNYLLNDYIITSEEIEFFDLISDSVYQPIKSIKKDVALLENFINNKDRILQSSTITVDINFDMFIVNLNDLKNILDFNTFLVLKGY